MSRGFAAGFVALAWSVAVALSTGVLRADERPLAARLADLGPRPLESAAHDRAVELLLGALRDGGLQGVEARPATVARELADPDALEVPPISATHVDSTPKPLTLLNLTGVLPGREEGEIVLSAHYDSVPGSAGAGDDASGCGAVVGAVAELRRTPLRRTVRVVLFDAEEAGLLGSKAWIEGLTSIERAAILAVINVEGVGWAGSAGPVVHSFPVRRAGARRLAPGWLVHGVLRGGESADLPLDMVDPWISLPAQLLVRSTHVRFGADSDSFLAAGVPALFVSDGSFATFDPAYHAPDDRSDRLDAARLERWSAAVAAMARRLDGLDGRPIDEDQYLVAFGRVWLRRDLLWLCFGVWVLHAVQGWRRGRANVSMTDFAFRTFLLLASLVTPVFTAALVLPAALIALRPPRSAVGRGLAVAGGLLPAAGLLGLAGLAMRRGFVNGWELGLPATLLLAATLAAFAAAVSKRPAAVVSS